MEIVGYNVRIVGFAIRRPVTIVASGSDGAMLSAPDASTKDPQLRYREASFQTV
jgi:hypothetical protein